MKISYHAQREAQLASTPSLNPEIALPYANGTDVEKYRKINVCTCQFHPEVLSASPVSSLNHSSFCGAVFSCITLTWALSVRQLSSLKEDIKDWFPDGLRREKLPDSEEKRSRARRDLLSQSAQKVSELLIIRWTPAHNCSWSINHGHTALKRCETVAVNHDA